MSHPSTRHAALLLAAIAASAAGAQNALDHNLQRGPGASRVNPAARQTDLRTQNEDVTGTLAGGRSFRGRVDYRPSGDFYGTVAADSLQRPLAFSAFSSPSFFNSPQRNDQFRVADNLGSFTFRREYATLPVIENVGQASALVENQIRLDRTNAAMISGTLFGTAVSSTSIGLVRDAERGSALVTASPLQGVRRNPLSDPLLAANLSPLDRARVMDDAREGTLRASSVGTPFRSALATPRSSSEVTPPAGMLVPPASTALVTGQVEAPRVEPTPIDRDAAYERIVERILVQFSDRDDVRITADERVLDVVRTRLEELRRNIDGTLPSTDSSGTRRMGDPGDLIMPGMREDAAPARPGMPMLPGERLREEYAPAAAPEMRGGAAELPGLGELTRDPLASPAEQRERDRMVPEERVLSIDEMATILRHGRLVESLTEGDRTRIAELIDQGQQLIAKGDFFRAERRFESALRLQPDHPMASVGIASSQIGAGLYLSAGLTLRKLFSTYPEMIDVRYADDLLPSRDRLDAVKAVCRERIGLGRDVAGYALVLAFVGHQTSDREAVVEGLEVVQTEDETRGLGELLWAIWVPKDDAAAAPSEEPAAEPSSP